MLPRSSEPFAGDCSLCGQCDCAPKLELLAKIHDRLIEVEQMPIGKSFWVNDLALQKGKPVYWSGAAWVKL